MPQFTVTIKESAITKEYRVFLQQWAKALRVSVDVLLKRILMAAIRGEQYVTKMPS